MGEAIGHSLPLAIGVALSPIPIIAVVVLLTSSRARSLGPVFVLGWLLGLVVVGAIMLVVVGPSGAGSSGQRTRWVSWVMIVLGVLLLVAAGRHLRSTRGGEEVPLPAWMGAIDRLNPAVVLGGGVVLGGVRPRSLLLVVGGAVAIAQTGIGVASRPSPTPSSRSSRPSALRCRWSSTSRWERGLRSCWVASRAGCAATTP